MVLFTFPSVEIPREQAETGGFKKDRSPLPGTCTAERRKGGETYRGAHSSLQKEYPRMEMFRQESSWLHALLAQPSGNHLVQIRVKEDVWDAFSGNVSSYASSARVTQHARIGTRLIRSPGSVNTRQRASGTLKTDGSRAFATLPEHCQEAEATHAGAGGIRQAVCPGAVCGHAGSGGRQELFASGVPGRWLSVPVHPLV